MKRLSFIFLFLLPLLSNGQVKHAKSTAVKGSEKRSIETIRRIFKDFIKYGEGIDSDENKAAITKALRSLPYTIDKADLPLLINVWMYYDPTDFDVKSAILPVLTRNKRITLDAIKYRRAHKKKWESKDTSPYTDLVYLERDVRAGAVK